MTGLRNLACITGQGRLDRRWTFAAFTRGSSRLGAATPTDSLYDRAWMQNDKINLKDVRLDRCPIGIERQREKRAATAVYRWLD